MPYDRLTVFWIGIAVTLVIFFAGIGFKLSFWARGRVRDVSGRLVERARVWVALRDALRVIFSRRFGSVAGAFLRDGLLHRRLWREDRYRWLTHFLMLFGFLALFTLSTITGFFEEILHFMFGVNTPLVEFITNKDTPLMAVLNEALGLLILIGLALTLIRRFIVRPSQLRTTAFDTTTMALLAIIMVTAYPTESFRLLMENVPPELGWYSFLGYPLARLIAPLNLNWPVWHYWTFMLHVAACFALAINMPFSKFFHVLVSPIIATANNVSTHPAEARS
jgi:nitrate reductase gamma subunit